MTDHRHQLDSKLASLLRMVVEDTTRTKQGLDSLYRRLVTLLVLRLVLAGYWSSKSANLIPTMNLKVRAWQPH